MKVSASCCLLQTIQKRFSFGGCICLKRYIICVVSVRNSLCGVSSTSCVGQYWSTFDILVTVCCYCDQGAWWKYRGIESLSDKCPWEKLNPTIPSPTKVSLVPILSKFLRQSLMIFIIKGFRTIVFIFIVIFTTFRPICPLAFFKCLSNSETFMELRTTSFIESTEVACSDSVRHNRVEELNIPVLILAFSQDWNCNPPMIVSIED